MEGADLVRGVTATAAFDWPAEDLGEFRVPTGRQAKARLKIAAYDFGMKRNILRRLSAYGCDVRVYPASTPAAELLASSPDGVFLSNGPGDPAAAHLCHRERAQRSSPPTCPCSGFAWGIRFWVWRWAPGRSN